ncbi:MAG: hypothetical protein LBH98_03410, partial [Chitinispirillales bacterium]|nr:hypothetical protein [Chitinispirillales bacterium]
MNKNNIISAIIMFFLFAASVFSQEEISVLDTNFVDTQAVDTLIADTDTTSADTDTILEFSKKTSWYFSLSPRVGNDK